MGLNVIMMGRPGRERARRRRGLPRARGLPKISTGDILREASRPGTAVALDAKSRMDAGELVDDATMIAIIRERLWRPDTEAGFVLDGFPRTVGQAQALDELMVERNNGPLIVVDIVVPEDGAACGGWPAGGSA